MDPVKLFEKHEKGERMRKRAVRKPERSPDMREDSFPIDPESPSDNKSDVSSKRIERFSHKPSESERRIGISELVQKKRRSFCPFEVLDEAIGFLSDDRFRIGELLGTDRNDLDRSREPGFILRNRLLEMRVPVAYC